MANQMVRMSESIRAEVSPEAADRIIELCGEMPLDACAQEQGIWIRDLVGHMDAQLSDRAKARVMESCGRQCIPRGVIADAKAAYATSRNLDEFIFKLNAMEINGGRLQRDGDSILVRYEECYCGVVNELKEPVSLTYCGCSVGWNKAFFEAVFQRDVEVKLLQSVISGASECLLSVRVLDASEVARKA